MDKKETWWTVGTNTWGEILTYDACENKEEAELFVKEELSGRGVVMTDRELKNEIYIEDEVEG